MADNGKGREQYLKWLKVNRAERLKKAADDYAELPPNIRAAIAKVAGVDNTRLDQMNLSERRKLNAETRKLIALLVKAHGIIVLTDFMGGA